VRYLLRPFPEGRLHASSTERDMSPSDWLTLAGVIVPSVATVLAAVIRTRGRRPRDPDQEAD